MVQAQRGPREIVLSGGAVVLDGIEVDGIVALHLSMAMATGFGSPTRVFDAAELVELR